MADVQVQKKAKIEERHAETIPSKIMWVNVVTNQNKETAEFYEKVLGWKGIFNDVSDKWMEVKGPQEKQTNVAFRPVSSLPFEAKVGQVGLTLVVPDLQKFHDHVKNIEGLKVAKEPTHEPWGGFIANYLSPGGTELTLLEEWEFKTDPKGSGEKVEKVEKVENVEKVEKEEKKQEEKPSGQGICFLELPYADSARARKFYTDTFGWTFTERGGNFFFESNDKTHPTHDLRGKLTEREDRLKGGLLYIYIQDMEKTIKDVKENGGSIIKEWSALPPMRNMKHYCAVVADTEGNEWGLYHNDSEPELSSNKRKSSE